MTFSLLINMSFKNTRFINYNSLILNSFIYFNISCNCLKMSENLNNIYY